MGETAQDEPRVSQEKELVKWVASSRPFRPLSRQLFSTGVAVCVLVAIIMAFAGEWVLIAVMVAGIFAYYMWSTVVPEEVEYRLTNRGLRAHGQLYSWAEMARWWSDEKWGYKLLVVDTPLTWPKRLHLVVKTEDESKVREVFEKYVVMEKPELTVVDKMGKWMADKFPLEAK